eukprot:TRINITY_DN39532_c0_g1_i1.p1 TRINITY_DN39532_c0_g1~~TRINITY_DN39532_c0_g1_i1.p1  ORF type:complete len:191 (+),score=53.48 TRINITY_DN39532_c0_g1_i1:51-575(+)
MAPSPAAAYPPKVQQHAVAPAACGSNRRPGSQKSDVNAAAMLQQLEQRAQAASTPSPASYGEAVTMDDLPYSNDGSPMSPAQPPPLPANLAKKVKADREAFAQNFGDLQAQYLNAVKRCEIKVDDRLGDLRRQLAASRSHEAPPSYPPSDIETTASQTPGRGPPEMVETDPEWD